MPGSDYYGNYKLYSLLDNEGMLEGSVNPEELLANANVGNTTFLPGGSSLNVGGGATYMPLNRENKINPMAFATFRSPMQDILLQGMMDEYKKSIVGNIGNLSGNITKDDYGTYYGANYSTPFLNGILNLEGNKTPEDKSLGLRYILNF